MVTLALFSGILYAVSAVGAATSRRWYWTGLMIVAAVVFVLTIPALVVAARAGVR